MDINKETNFQEWYVEILKKAEIVDARYNSKGMFVWLPYGFKIMRAIKEFWDKLFQDAGIQEYYFPEIVPLDYAQQNESWWQSFKDEGYKVVAGKNEIQGVIRPTGEPAMYPMFKLWIRTYTDLPLRLYQTSSAFRYESKSTHPLIRDREITIWHEIHTAHATEKGAENEAELHMQLWEKLWGVLALPIWKVKKPQWECFAGAVGAIEYYTLLPSGRVMETGSINNLGQAYAKKFDIKFKDANGKEDFVWQICTGVGARLLAAVIGIHGDNKGLILPPEIAQIKCVIVPIIFKGKEKSVIEKANEIEALLNKGGIATKVDMRDEIAAGSKFYEWEAKGVPIRIEIGPRDLEKNQITIVKRNDNKKIVVSENE
ncbi:MAG: proline--tRNA ligase, partial [Euryarchaeota archaeon HGW-Euryarchaeota-1]